MAANNNQFNLTSLDFDQNKQALINFLQGQTTFTDYNFQGSNLSILLDLLALNNNYLSYYLNLVANEMFLDSATLRQSVVSHAKELGYIPASNKCSQALVSLQVIPPANSYNNPPFITLDQYTQFSTSLSNAQYNFLTNQAYSIPYDPVNQVYTLTQIPIYEGKAFSFRFTVDNTITNQLFEITNQQIDTSTIQVLVQASPNNSATSQYTLAQDITSLDNNSLVYFIQQNTNGNYELFFGDGVLGYKPPTGSLVYVNFIACNAGAANGAVSFTCSATVSGFSNIQVTTLSMAGDGDTAEDIESIRFHAPRSYGAQNRAVTADDYTYLVKQKYPNISAVSVYGGEDLVPPQYGKVFVSIQPTTGYVLSNATKQFIVNNILSPYNVMTIQPEIVDPDYIYITISSLVKYQQNSTQLSATALSKAVLNVIASYCQTNVGTFSQNFRYSRLIAAIDKTDASILSNVTSVKLEKRFTPILNAFGNFTLSFNENNPIVPGSVSSTQFVVSNPNSGFLYLPGDVHYFGDDSNGNLLLYKISGTTTAIVNSKAGTVDYKNGIIVVSAFIPSSVSTGDGTVRVYATPVQNDVVLSRNNVIIVDPSEITVSVQAY